MADDDGLFFAERGDERDHVADGVENTVGIDIGRRAGSAEAAHIGCRDTESGRGDRRDLMPPGIGQFGPAVAQQHQRTRALFQQKNLDAVGGNRT
jgi:hypothetical protein